MIENLLCDKYFPARIVGFVRWQRDKIKEETHLGNDSFYSFFNFFGESETRVT